MRTGSRGDSNNAGQVGLSGQTGRIEVQTARELAIAKVCNEEMTHLVLEPFGHESLEVPSSDRISEKPG